MNTYLEIQGYVKNKYGFSVKTCWIAHTKELCGIKVKKSWNRKSQSRVCPCPKNKLEVIKEALEYFKIRP